MRTLTFRRRQGLQAADALLRFGRSRTGATGRIAAGGGRPCRMAGGWVG
jgi:hypothetical protein